MTSREKWGVAIVLVVVLAWYLYSRSGSTVAPTGTTGGGSNANGTDAGGSSAGGAGGSTSTTPGKITVPTVGGGSVSLTPTMFTPYSTSGAGQPIVGNNWTTAAEQAPAGTIVAQSNIGPVVKNSDGTFSAPTATSNGLGLAINTLRAAAKTSTTGLRATTLSGAPTSTGSVAPSVSTLHLPTTPLALRTTAPTGKV
jgi:hypothetical protein